jgi:formamidopyrimidine-DNA glycosylase
MIEIPEAIVVARQLEEAIQGKTISHVIAGASPHKFAFYYEDPAAYDKLLKGKKVKRCYPQAGRIEVELEDAFLSFFDGVNLRILGKEDKLPVKHQLLIEFTDETKLFATIAMYGGLHAFPFGAMEDNMYFNASRTAISPLSDEFSYEYFTSLFDEVSLKMSAKAFLATKQRIPGLGNGVLQDILLNAKIHPKRKMNTLTETERRDMFDSIKSTLSEMVKHGGRDTEKDLYGNVGGYMTKLSKNRLQAGCCICGGEIKKEAYMGGSIYYCINCQPLT